jgi:hypothetical protein
MTLARQPGQMPTHRREHDQPPRAERSPWRVWRVIGEGALAGLALVGCGERVGEYLPASAIARGGFASDEWTVAEIRGREVRLWGFVDQGNLYGDADAKRVLGEWWSGQGPDPEHWRFDLKAEANDPVGLSFAVLVPNDPGREDILHRLVADARAQRATKIFVAGRLFTFHAPTQIRGRTGLYLQVRSSQDLRLDRPDGDETPDGAGIGPNAHRR